ncbi:MULTISPECIES: hypothetical protein [unclassified Mycobacterium]|uniref:hypothetical protein n=1 Tax=unclassified Mycobacterium TaxID=2642494 RepID=UPI0029C6C08A|nr:MULTISPECIES: hypothetical protein [unclassified Mycobacterium]
MGDSDESGDHYPPGWAPEPLPKPPRRRGGYTKWIGLIALAVVVAVVVGAILLFTGDDPSAPGSDKQAAPTTPAAASSATTSPTVIASASDAGPVAIITTDVTCQSWRSIQSTLASAQSNGWEQRDASIPASAWNPAQRTQFEAVGTAMKNTADDAVGLARQTPHRVLRELYEAFIAYGRSYADSLADYQPADDMLARTNIAAFQSISEICAAADSGSAISRAPAVPSAAPPTAPAPPGNPASPERFIPQAGPTCGRWVPAESTMQTDTQAWRDLNPDILADKWTPEQRAVQERTAALLGGSATTLEAAGRGSGNAVFEDFATLAAQYFRAYVAAMPTYAAGDHYLASAGLRLDNLVSAACQAAPAG